MVTNFDRGHAAKHEWLRSALFRMWAAPAMYPLLRRVAAEIPVIRGRLLDVRCGRGRLAREIATARPALKVVAIDESRERLALAGQVGSSTNLEFRCACVEGAQFESEFDFALSFLYFRRWEQPAAGLASVYQALRWGGRFWVYVPDREATAEVLKADYEHVGPLPAPPPSALRFIWGNRGFTHHELLSVVRPVVAATSFKDFTVTRSGSMLRLEFVKQQVSQSLSPTDAEERSAAC
jgi:SAM-dependent methyltransferase